MPENKIDVASEENLSSEEKILPDWLEKIDGINIDDGIKHCGGLEPYLEALKVFANSIENGATEIQNYFDNEDWKNYITKVHALKSSSRVIGAKKLSELAEKLENDGNSNNIDEIKNNTESLIKIYKNFAEKLKPLIESEIDNSDKPLISEDELNERTKH